MNNKRKWLLRAIGVILLLIVIGVAGFAIYFSNALPASQEAVKALESGNGVTVSNLSDQIVFMPEGTPKSGYIFYPGGRVSPSAYAVKMHAIAQEGYAVFIVKVPLNLAFFGVNQGSSIIAAHPEIKTWAVGGHSLGGVAASMFVAGRSDVQALILYASYPASSLAMRTDFAVTSIYGTNDGLATPAKIESNKPLLPATTQYIGIEGGIHGYFGDYGPQDGDGVASISREDATKQIVTASVQALSEISKPD